MMWIIKLRWWLLRKIAGKREVAINLKIEGSLIIEGIEALILNCRLLGKGGEGGIKYDSKRLRPS
ncbi:hypothetical protein LCGC14_0720630 [marine sediment metagenome]|uniref:Uncharacterized protein n=1 Tax=marine sediment metagenome TaxID=412755 RepID=A0A0F9TJV9_9ZZZZ